MLYWSRNGKDHKKSSDFVQKKKKSFFMYEKENIWILNALYIYTHTENSKNNNKITNKKNILLLFINRKFPVETATE